MEIHPTADTHTFYIPVMGTGFSIDTPLRVARFGISSAMSLVDDALVERVRLHYARVYDIAAEAIPAHAADARARRITAWLDLVDSIVRRQIAALRALSLEPGSDKSKYFELLPEDSLAKRKYLSALALDSGDERSREEAELDDLVVPGFADVNIMTKLDRARGGTDGADNPELSDAKAALRGFARSRIEASVVLSAGMNPTLFGALEAYPDFYRDDRGTVKKGVIVKVSDFRSAFVQGKFLAKKGIEVREFRIESGLNCGGHAFTVDGEVLGPILDEFRAKRASLRATFEPVIRQYYANRGMPFVGGEAPLRVTVQGGIGTHGEVQRLRETYGVDATGWASPFLLVREATALDDATRAALAAAKEQDLYLSDASPLGVPFNNLRGSSSQRWQSGAVDRGRPGSQCPRGYLASNTEFTKQPVCTASRTYQLAKLAALGFLSPPPSNTTDERARAVYEKECLCNHLGNGALIDLGIVRSGPPVAVCPGPNIAYFGREATLREMVDHIYGRGLSLASDDRPHMFAKELTLNVDRLLVEIGRFDGTDAKIRARLARTVENLERALEHYRRLAGVEPYDGENLDSLARAIGHESTRIAFARGAVAGSRPGSD